MRIVGFDQGLFAIARAARLCAGACASDAEASAAWAFVFSSPMTGTASPACGEH
jgi:hypothetical protein